MAVYEVEPTTELGRRLEKERINRGLTKAQWIKELNTSRPTYIQWLTRPVGVSKVNIRAIAQKMGVPAGEVYEWIIWDGPDTPVNVTKGVSLHSLLAPAA